MRPFLWLRSGPGQRATGTARQRQHDNILWMDGCCRSGRCCRHVVAEHEACCRCVVAERGRCCRRVVAAWSPGGGRQHGMLSLGWGFRAGKWPGTPPERACDNTATTRTTTCPRTATTQRQHGRPRAAMAALALRGSGMAVPTHGAPWAATAGRQQGASTATTGRQHGRPQGAATTGRQQGDSMATTWPTAGGHGRLRAWPPPEPPSGCDQSGGFSAARAKGAKDGETRGRGGVVSLELV